LLSTQREGGEEMVRALVEFTQQRAVRLKKAAQKAEALSAQASPSSKAEKNAGIKAVAPSDLSTGDDDAWGDEAEGEAESTAAPAGAEDTSVIPSELPTSAARQTRRPPPVSAIALALSKLKTPGAAAALCPYLSDPSLSAREVKTVMKTVFELGGPEETAAVHQFVLEYKNTGGEEELLDALVQGVEFLLTHLEPELRTEVKAEINESLTHPDLKKRARLIKIRRVVDPDSAPKAASDSPTVPSGAAKSPAP
jgi:hypothetical protein